MSMRSERVARLWLRQADVSDEPEDLRVLGSLLAHLRALQWVFWHSHWITAGPTFYQEHLLFERLYDSDALKEEIDTLGEKIIAMYGSKSLGMTTQAVLLGDIVREAAASNPNLIDRALGMERAFQVMVQNGYDILKASDKLTLGMDDFLMSMASRHESNIYLLQQMKAPPYETAVNRVARLYLESSSAEHYFVNNPEFWEVREFAQSGAPCNIHGVVVDMDDSTPQDLRDVEKSPYTPTEITSQPGGSQFSTLNRYLIHTKQPGVHGVTQSWRDKAKHPKV